VEVVAVGDDTVGSTTVELGAQPQCAGRAREVLRRSLAGFGDELVDTACLLADELVANALLHVGAALEMTVMWTEHAVRVEVVDRSPEPPTRRRRDLDGLHGRGLHMLDDLADEWGTARHPLGKSVWFSLVLPGRRG
jgi:anti-sigma regulatory factor (Ser/Thr protein kinase)